MGGGGGGGARGYHFWDFQTILFLEKNAFQAIFFIAFCDKNNFFMTILKNIEALLYILFWKKKQFLSIHTHGKVSFERKQIHLL